MNFESVLSSEFTQLAPIYRGISRIILTRIPFTIQHLKRSYMSAQKVRDLGYEFSLQ